MAEQLKKTIVFTSDKSKNFMEGAMNLFSSKWKTSPSAALELLVEKALLPDNEAAKLISRLLISGERNFIDSIGSICDLYSAGIGGEARWQNGYEFVFFCNKIFAAHRLRITKSNDGDYQYFLSNARQLVFKMEYHFPEKSETESHYNNPAKLMKYYFDQAINEPEFFSPNCMIGLILEHWQELGNFTYTYRVIYSLTRLLNNKNEPPYEYKLELLEIIKKLSAEWK